MKILKFFAALYFLFILTWIAASLDRIANGVGDLHEVRAWISNENPIPIKAAD